MISIRHTDTLALVSGDDGHVIWRCGGKLSNFTFDKDAKFSRQHDARYLEHTKDRSVVSLMDNAIGDMQQDKQPATHDYSRGLILELSHKQGEPFVAKMLKQYRRPDGGYADRRGNLQILPSGNVIMAWTDAGYLSEHSDDDNVLMEAKWLKRGRFDTYRAYKFDTWVGEPDTLPDVKAFGYGSEDGESTVAIYVSWNGATEAWRWRFSANGNVLGETDKTGFETVFAANDVSGKIQVEALDSKGKQLALSDKVEIEWMTGAELVKAKHSIHPAVWIGIFLCSAIVGVVAFWTLRAGMRFYREQSRRRMEQEYKEIPLDEPMQR